MAHNIPRQVLWKKVYASLASEIGKFRSGDNFHTLAEIRKKYRVSQITALRALTELQHDGLVEKIQRRGTIVKQIREPLTIKLLIPGDYSTIKDFLANPIHMKIQTGIVLETAKLRLPPVETLSEQYFRSEFLEGKTKTGLLVYHRIGKDTLVLLRKKGIPFVLLHPALEPVDRTIACVKVDKKKAGALATEHLISLGHTRIAFVGGPITRLLQRFKGYLKALKHARIEFDWSYVKETGGFDAGEDAQAMEELLSLGHPPSAVFAADDYRAIHILDYCRRNAIRVPGEMSLAGYDNINESALVTPALTTVDTHLEEVGREGLRTIVSLLTGTTGKRAKTTIIQPELVVRGTTARRNTSR